MAQDHSHPAHQLHINAAGSLFAAAQHHLNAAHKLSIGDDDAAREFSEAAQLHTDIGQSHGEHAHEQHGPARG